MTIKKRAAKEATRLIQPATVVDDGMDKRQNIKDGQVRWTSEEMEARLSFSHIWKYSKPGKSSDQGWYCSLPAIEQG